ncbi:MAG: MATE family efflux transporter [Candidatus Cloacimonadota bacterium]|nr:MAG: MATE family efflux transporter [Candidatus Cloacimonadota bacterium]
MSLVISKKRLKVLFTLAIPIIAGMLSQNLLNLVDTAMVGQLSSTALAAVGLCTFLNFMAVGALMGFSSGVQAISARRIGEERSNEAAKPLNFAIILIFFLSCIITSISYFLIPKILPFLNSDPKVVQSSIDYFSIRIFGVVFIGLNASFRGFFNAVGLERSYLKILVTMHFLNILFNYLLIFGKFGFPALGVKGAAIGTVLSLSCGTVLYFYEATKKAKKYGFLERSFSFKEVKNLISISLPRSVNQLFYGAGLSALFLIIGKVGTNEMAGANILMNIMMVATLPGIGFGFTSATLCSQALGRGDKEDAYQWCIDIVKVSFTLISCLALLMILFPESILSIFTKDKEIIAVSLIPLRLTGLLVSLDVCGKVLMHSLLGVGDSKHVMFVSTSLQWFFFLPLVYLIGPVLHYNLIGIWMLQGIYRSIQAAIFAKTWYNRKWVQIVI